MTTETIRVGAVGLSLDLILWRRFKRLVPGLAEQVFATNPGLADAGPLLPLGTVFVVEIPTAPPEAAVVKLWD